MGNPWEIILIYNKATVGQTKLGIAIKLFKLILKK